MKNKFGISQSDLNFIRQRDKKCVYCKKSLLYPYTHQNHKDSATLEHFRENGPFYIKNGLKLEDIAYCCGECNSSRNTLPLLEWFKTDYCKSKDINKNTVADEVKNYLKRI